LPETDGGTQYITANECRILHGELVKDVAENRAINTKLTKILIGNGDVGLVEKVNQLYHRNQLVDQVFGVIKSILVTLLTLYLSGVLHL